MCITGAGGRAKRGGGEQRLGHEDLLEGAPELALRLQGLARTAAAGKIAAKKYQVAPSLAEVGRRADTA